MCTRGRGTSPVLVSSSSSSPDGSRDTHANWHVAAMDPKPKTKDVEMAVLILCLGFLTVVVLKWVRPYFIDKVCAQHLQRFDGFGGSERNLFTFVEALAGEIGFGSEDFLPWSPSVLDRVAATGFIFGFLVFGAEVLKEGLISGELFGAEGFGYEVGGGKGSGGVQWRRGKGGGGGKRSSHE